MPQTLPPPSASLSSLPLRVRRRPDLESITTLHRHTSATIIKDPIAMRYHRLSPEENFVLQSLDGSSSLDQIRDQYTEKFFPQRVTTSDLNRLLLRFHTSGLTVSDAAMQGKRMTDRRRKEHRQRWIQCVSSILFIRFPGIDPEPVLKKFDPMFRVILSRLGFIASVLFCVLSAILFLTQWTQFHTEFPETREWLRVESLIVLAGVIGLTKICHELGHAMVCRRFGGECHQIGPMLLVFTPALYCDTSDSWMLSNRWKRAAVGMAGIATEVLLASLATWVWLLTAPGITHFIAMNVMVVCSVSTVLINANPLLRYDGYFVLSDLCDTPNLAEQARRLLKGYVNRWILGVDELPDDAIHTWKRTWMLCYAVLATLYRWCLTVLILWIVSQVLRPYGLESISLLLTNVVVAGLLYSLVQPMFRFLQNPARRRGVRRKNLLITTVTIALLIAFACFPFPSGIITPANLKPRAEIPLYVATPGTLREVKRFPGDFVEKNELIATLENHDVELQYLAARGRYETQKRILESTRSIALQHPNAANDIPAQEASLNDLAAQLRNQEAKREGLQVRAPTSGRLIAAPRKKQEAETVFRLVTWSGYPTDAQNINCYLTSGRELVSISQGDDWDAELILDQSDVDRIDVGAFVKLALGSSPTQCLRGKVTNISQTAWVDEVNHERRDDFDAARQLRPAATAYAVRVAIDPVDLHLVPGATAIARIESAPISLVGRTSRFLSSLLRFR